MYQIDNSTAATTKPVPAPLGTPGYFTGGNPQSGEAATIVDADWLNMLQGELGAILGSAAMAQDKTNNGQVMAALTKLFSGGIKTLNPIVYKANAVYAPSPYLKFAVVFCKAGGGGGGSAVSTAAQWAAAGGGGEGCYAMSVLTAGQIGGNQPITIGAGGLGGSAINQYGANGGNTSFGSLVVADGGNGGPSGNANTFAIVGGAMGGNGGAGQIVVPGCCGTGGTSIYGGYGGGKGAGVGTGEQLNGTGTNGVSANPYGGGGGGGAVCGTNSAGVVFTGGTGGSGFAFVLEFIG